MYRHSSEAFKLLLGITLIVLTYAVPLGAQQQFADLGTFSLENGGEILDCRIGYRTYGELNTEKSNAVLFPTWLGGNSAGLEFLMGADKVVDTTRFFVIAVDAFGDGVSSSPSNSTRQHGRLFPRFTIHDMVRAQHELLTNHLSINHLHGIIGGSMGGMQVFDWITAYPEFMDAAVSYVGTPRLTSYDRLLWETELHIIDSLSIHGASPEAVSEVIGMMTSLAIQTPRQRVVQTPYDKYDGFFSEMVSGFRKNFNAEDWRSQLRAVLGHDVSRHASGSLESAAELVKTRLLIIVASEDHMVNPAPALEFARYAGADSLVLNSDCGHLAPGCEMARFRKVVTEFLNR